MPNSTISPDASLRTFLNAVATKLAAQAAGQPEDQLRGPFESLLVELGAYAGLAVVTKGESLLAGRLGRPDYAVLVGGLLAGYVELKEPGKGVEGRRFSGHDRRQWERFQQLPNVLYTDGQDWAVYRGGEPLRSVVAVADDIRLGANSLHSKNVPELSRLITDFLSWQPIVPGNVQDLAEMLAPLCRNLRDEVAEGLAAPQSALRILAADWRQLLFPDADDRHFADSYAQTVTFALLLARSEGATVLELRDAISGLAAHHSLLSKALQVLTDDSVRAEIQPALALLQRVIDRIPERSLGKSASRDPWLYFYETFLAEYDANLRRDAGVYYTPVEVVKAQVALVDELLRERLRKRYSYAEDSVVTLDPAVGTGTYLLGIIEHSLRSIEREEGTGAVAARAEVLGRNLRGFEVMTGPYAVAELRLSRALADHGAQLPANGVGVYLTDALESPFTEPLQLPLILRALADQHRRALVLKDQTPVLVCIGNPPYDRHVAADDNPSNRARTGNWVRWGDPHTPDRAPILSDFTKPVIDAGNGGQLKNMYNLYVYFWRWALWKVFEHNSSSGMGIVSFISGSSYLEGDAFAGMREHMRRVCSDIWIIDLGGEGRGTRRNENVFQIQTPVAIAVAARLQRSSRKQPARVHYTSIEGTRAEKLDTLGQIERFGDLQWQPAPTDWAAPFRPRGAGEFFRWPLLSSVFPWLHSGAQWKRSWPIAPDRDTLERRWRDLLKSENRAKLFYETRDRKVGQHYQDLFSRRQAVSGGCNTDNCGGRKSDSRQHGLAAG